MLQFLAAVKVKENKNITALDVLLLCKDNGNTSCPTVTWFMLFVAKMLSLRGIRLECLVADHEKTELCQNLVSSDPLL